MTARGRWPSLPSRVVSYRGAAKNSWMSGSDRGCVKTLALFSWSAKSPAQRPLEGVSLHFEFLNRKDLACGGHRLAFLHSLSRKRTFNCVFAALQWKTGESTEELLTAERTFISQSIDHLICAYAFAADYFGCISFFRTSRFSWNRLFSTS